MIRLHSKISWRQRVNVLAGAVVLCALSACGGGDNQSSSTPAGPTNPIQTTLSCDDSLKSSFKPDANTVVLLAKQFKAGDKLTLNAATATASTPTTTVDVCFVKLLVGPGNPGAAGAPSTSAGIGIEVWLPAASSWNTIIRATGSGGWAGGAHTDLTQIGTRSTALPAINKGYVVSTSDHGHSIMNNGSFAMNPDGSINTVLWHDFAERSLHEIAVQTKALVKAFYGQPQSYAYWDGFSTGGRQGFKLAQKYPADFNGILAGAPAFNWSKFITAELYPQIAMLRELGAPISGAKLNLVSGAAVKSCDTLGVGYLVDPLQCRYDPTKDVNVLCAGVAGNGVTGASTSPNCVNLTEANVINQIWYGQTASGTYADPAVDNAGSPTLMGSDQLWYGLTRGTNLGLSLAGATPFVIATDQVALELQDGTYAGAAFQNAKANGANKWKTLDYAGLANAFAQGVALQASFSNINTDTPDLSGFRDASGKVLTYHGLADDKIFPQGSINYFARVSAQMGGDEAVQSFVRLFMIPGLAHDGSFSSSASIDPSTNASLNAAKLPLPQNASGRDELFNALRDWVEKGTAPSQISVSSADGSASMPLCLYPKRITYRGSGAVTASSSYSCQ